MRAVPIIVGTAVAGGPVHMVREIHGRTVCSFLTIVPPRNRRMGRLDAITCQSCLRGAELRLAQGNYLKPFVVMRQDDNGQKFKVGDYPTREAADQAVSTFEAKGHKQLYWVA